MTSDEKDSPSAGRSDPGDPKKPTRTIDLEAQEVEDKDGETEGDRGAESDAAGQSGSAERPQAAGGSEDRETREAAGPAAGSGKGGGPETAGKPPGRGEPPPRTRLSEVRAFVTHLAAGLLGGLVGVIGAGIGLDRLPVEAWLGGGESGQPQQARLEKMTGQLDNLTGRLESLDARVTANAQALETRADADAIDALRTRVGAVESLETRIAAVEALENRIAAAERKAAEATDASDDLARRLASLETQIKTLGESADETGSGSLAQAAALTGRIEEVSSELGTRISGLERELDSVKQALAAQPDSIASGADLAALGERLADLETRLGESDPAALRERLSALETRVSEAETPAADGAPGKSAALAITFAALQRAIERGEPFAEELARVRRLAPGGLDFSALAAHADSGVATRESLARALPGAVRAARNAGEEPEPEPDSLIGRLVSNARSVVRVRRVGPDGGDEANDALSRMESEFHGGDLAGALEAASRLQGAALEAMQPWLAGARARRDAEQGLESLESRLAAALESPDNGAPR